MTRQQKKGRDFSILYGSPKNSILTSRDTPVTRAQALGVLAAYKKQQAELAARARRKDIWRLVLQVTLALGAVFIGLQVMGAFFIAVKP